MNQAFTNAGLFLIETLFDLYLFILAIRLILAYRNIRYFNPIVQVIIKLTQPLVNPVRRIFPSYKGIEFSTFVIFVLLDTLKYYLIGFLTIGLPLITGLCLLVFADIFKIILNIFFYSILIQALLSWIQPHRSPISELLEQITLPIMKPFRRVIPLVSGFDLSPIPAMIFLQFLLILFVNPLMLQGMYMAFNQVI